MGITSFLFEKAFNEAYTKLREGLKREDINLKVSKHELEHSFQNLSKKIQSWCQNLEGISFENSKDVKNTYIDLEYYVTARYNHFANQGTNEKLIDTIFSQTDKHLAIVGEAGMGKTTSMKMITYKCITEENYLSDYTCPLVVLCRKINNTDVKCKYVVTEYLQEELGILVRHNKDIFKDFKVESAKIRHEIWDYIDALKCLLIVDGFDELPILQQSVVYQELNEISQYLQKSKLIITSRTSNFDFSPSNIHVFEIAPFKPSQILEFSEKWLGQEKGSLFYIEIMNSAFNDVAGQPLILSYLAGLYSINNRIPEIPKNLYRDVIEILFMRWDKVRGGIHRESKYANFDYIDKLSFLSHLAYKLLCRNLVYFNRLNLVTAYDDIKKFYPNLPQNSPEEVVNEIRDHSGIILVCGYDLYQFSHKSIQEYLAGFYIANYNPLDDDIKNELAHMPLESAMATVLTRNTSNLFIDIINLTKSQKQEQKKYIEIYLDRIVQQKTVFNPTEKLGYYVLKLWNDHFIEDKISNNKLFLGLYKLSGIKESILLFNDRFKADHGVISESYIKSNPNAIVSIFARSIADTVNYQSPIKVPLYLIKNWKYVKVNFKDID
ncbi:MAG: NACHT domain-containing protein [Bacteroidetes bacterium]|nr:NACHT domain-containing protein [Bacteroidota bacterium]